MSEPELYPVRFIYHNNTYSGTLYDVDGNVLIGETGQKLNIFKEEMKDMLIAKKIRYIHYMGKEPTYSYFITESGQVDRFILERLEGGPNPDKYYHVYPDY
jgi:hypothetical protein